mgnify:CR=1 FL=1
MTQTVKRDAAVGTVIYTKALNNFGGPYVYAVCTPWCLYLYSTFQSDGDYQGGKRVCDEYCKHRNSYLVNGGAS